MAEKSKPGGPDNFLKRKAVGDTEDEYCSYKKQKTENDNTCRLCLEIEKKYKNKSTARNLFRIHIDRNLLTSNKEYKKTKLGQVIKCTSALRNSKGGEILIHFDKKETWDKWLEHFDEIITKKLCDLINDGSTYVDTYTRHWLCDVSGFHEDKNFLIVGVRPSDTVVTVDFHTKLRHDHENIDPTFSNITSLLSKQSGVSEERKPFDPFPIDTQSLHETRSIELKTLMPKGDIESDPSKLVDYIWENLKLNHNLTSMSKIIGGGSVFIGISEKKTNAGQYKTIEPDTTGFDLKVEKNDLEEKLYSKIRSNAVLFRDGEYITPSDNLNNLIQIKFHCARDPKKHILEIVIKQIDGLVFYDKDGPLTYCIKDGNIERMDKEEWRCSFDES